MLEKSESFRPSPLRIGNIVVDPPVVLAPMAGVTDDIYRHLMARHGAGLVTTEMVSIEGLVRNQAATWRLCSQEPPLDVPLAVQLFGRDPAVVAEAARRVEAKGAAIIDLNAGCPVRKVVKQGAGASLLKEPDQLAMIVEATKKAVKIPVTVKIRVGWDSASIQTIEIARRLESAGVDAIAIHGRTAVQQYTGTADWSWIRQVKEAVEVPIIGNGDITTPTLANEMFRQTGCDGVMIGRGSMGNPWIFTSLALQWGRPVQCNPVPDWEEFSQTVHWHLETFRRQKPRPAGHLRKLLIWYSRGCPGAAKLRQDISRTEEPDAMLAQFRGWVREVAERGSAFLPSKVPEAA